MIIALKNRKTDSIEKKSSFVSNLTVEIHSTVVKLVGKRYLVKCKISEVSTKELWDTGTEVLQNSKKWIEENYIPTKLKIFQSY